MLIVINLAAAITELSPGMSVIEAASRFPQTTWTESPEGDQLVGTFGVKGDHFGVHLQFDRLHRLASATFKRRFRTRDTAAAVFHSLSATLSERLTLPRRKESGRKWGREEILRSWSAAGVHLHLTQPNPRTDERVVCALVQYSEAQRELASRDRIFSMDALFSG